MSRLQGLMDIRLEYRRLLSGMVEPGRKYSAGSSYRYAFNGKEKDKDISEGAQDYGMRIYDSRIAKFLSPDPLGRKYPELTPYQFASNTPVRAVDIDGLEAGIISYGYRVTAILVTGSVSIGATIDWQGNFKLYTQWSAGLGAGAYAGGGVSLSIYPHAMTNEIMGGAINFGGSVGLPGLSASLDINVNLLQNDITKKYDDFRLGASGGIKPGSLGPGGVEAHIDFSNSTPFFSANLFGLGVTRNSIIASIKDEVNDSWFLDLTELQINNLVGYIYSTQQALKKIKDDSNPPPAPPALPRVTPPQAVRIQEIRQQPIINNPFRKSPQPKQTNADKRQQSHSKLPAKSNTQATKPIIYS